MPVFAFDLDGTICFGNGAIEGPILKTLTGLPTGIRVVIASARHPVNIAQAMPSALFDTWDIIGANGAIVQSDGILKRAYYLRPGSARMICAKLDALGCAYLAYGVDFVWPGKHPHALQRIVKNDIGEHLRLGNCDDLDHTVKILALPEADAGAALSMCQGHSNVDVQSHSDNTFDVIPIGVNKARGLEDLMSDEPVFAAFGNDTNDVEMLRMAQHAIAVGMHPSIRLLADRIVPESADQIQHICQNITALSRAALARNTATKRRI
ncbi:MAG: HAD hydrolase family protein [Paracoccaceae bacterium]